MRITPRMLLLAGVALVSVGVIADTIPTFPDAESYLLGRRPEATSPQKADGTAKPAATIEKATAINGQGYAVIAPVYMGTTMSYIRLFNGGAAAANFSISIVGSPSGTTYKVQNISVPSRASPQYAIKGTAESPGILEIAGISGLQGSDDKLSLYIQSTESTAGYQHVTFNTVNKFFENASICKYTLNHTVQSVVNSAVLINIHTSLFGAYASTIDFHNFWNAPINYTFTVIDAATGAVINQTSFPTQANASYSIPFSQIQSAINWTPNGQLHANLVVTDPSGAVPYILLGQSIFNTELNANINMSPTCAVNAPVPADTGGGFGGGGISY
jgi:hypothetical protein